MRLELRRDEAHHVQTTLLCPYHTSTAMFQGNQRCRIPAHTRAYIHLKPCHVCNLKPACRCTAQPAMVVAYIAPNRGPLIHIQPSTRANAPVTYNPTLSQVAQASIDAIIGCHSFVALPGFLRLLPAVQHPHPSLAMVDRHADVNEELLYLSPDSIHDSTVNIMLLFLGPNLTYLRRGPYP